MGNWFYTKQITLLKETDGYLYHGSWVEGIASEGKTISCDVQPSNREQIYKDYGYYIDCSYRVFCDIDNDIAVGGIVRYKGNNFDIVKVIEWDNYLDVFIQERGS